MSLPGEEEAVSITDGNEDGTFVLSYKDGNASALAYQRIDVDGIWSTIVSKSLRCN